MPSPLLKRCASFPQLAMPSGECMLFDTSDGHLRQSCGSPFNCAWRVSAQWHCADQTLPATRPFHFLAHNGLIDRVLNPLLGAFELQWCDVPQSDYYTRGLNLKQVPHGTPMVHNLDGIIAAHREISGLAAWANCAEHSIKFNGTHGAGLACCREFLRHHGEDSVVAILDAHADCNRGNVSESHNQHGTHYAESMGTTIEPIAPRGARPDEMMLGHVEMRNPDGTVRAFLRRSAKICFGKPVVYLGSDGREVELSNGPFLRPSNAMLLGMTSIDDYEYHVIRAVEQHRGMVHLAEDVQSCGGFQPAVEWMAKKDRPTCISYDVDVNCRDEDHDLLEYYDGNIGTRAQQNTGTPEGVIPTRVIRKFLFDAGRLPSMKSLEVYESSPGLGVRYAAWGSKEFICGLTRDTRVVMGTVAAFAGNAGHDDFTQSIKSVDIRNLPKVELPLDNRNPRPTASLYRSAHWSEADDETVMTWEVPA